MTLLSSVITLYKRMEKIQIAKDKLRKEVSIIKNKLSKEELICKSEEVLSVVEITGVFQNAKSIFIYNSLSDEVNTSSFIQKWIDQKKFYLPVIKEDNLIFREYNASTQLSKSTLGILEPQSDDFFNYKTIDLVVIPGIAFDRKMNRLGRGKGYYDRFLKEIKAPKMGICFDFQLYDQIPFSDLDVKMDYIVSENDLIW